ncbi:glycosyltransferase, family GT83. Putative undecaprenyl-glycosyl transferase [Tenacibaculum sp. 190130A14a]|uniref:4-amino-4-deoxy-L-arabinose transferase n=1 Tax=Tenacibaculum polynesiense TaxID=3137857 RepID=A0ABM9P760_9FLAO
MKQFLNKKTFFGYAVLGLLLLRSYLNAVLPLMDKTEARYAEIARIMAETNNWITPQIDYGIPFWAKPPLSTWLSALSISLFGDNEFSVRLPYLILALAIILLVGKYGKRAQLSYFFPAFILLTIPEFLLHAGVVSTDTALAFCVALTMLSFWEAIQENAKWYWKYLIFVGLGFGLLAKGPIVGILTLPPIIIWLALHKKLLFALKKTPIILGILIILCIALPWYLLAEKNTPGFIDYFIVGEHFKRFFDSSWSGDKYGFPKSQPLGMVWIFLLFFALKWIQVVLYKVWQKRKTIKKHPWISFLLLWLLWTPFFFTFSKSLIHPYILPVMVPIALLITHWFSSFNRKKTLINIALVFPILSLFIIVPANFLGCTKYFAPTDKYLIFNSSPIKGKLFHLKSKSYSSQFYSKGNIESISIPKLEQTIQQNEDSFKVIIPNKTFHKISLETRKKLQPLDKNHKKGIYAFFKSKS